MPAAEAGGRAGDAQVELTRNPSRKKQKLCSLTNSVNLPIFASRECLPADEQSGAGVVSLVTQTTERPDEFSALGWSLGAAEEQPW